MNEKKALIPVEHTGELAYYLDSAKFEHSQRVASMLSKATMLPKQYRNSPADCLIALNQAALMGIDPMLFMQKTYVVGGKIGMESQLVIALANKSKKFKDVIQYKFTGSGDKLKCTASARTAATDALCEATCSVQDAKDMGWWSRPGSPWPKQTKKMLRYRSAMNLVRYFCPEVLLGFDNAEELRDMPPSEIDITPTADKMRPPTFMTPDEKKQEIADSLPLPEINSLKPELSVLEKDEQKKTEDQFDSTVNGGQLPDAAAEGIEPEFTKLQEIYENPENSAVIQKLITKEILPMSLGSHIEDTVERGDVREAQNIIQLIEKNK
jgi:hypothetical protein